MATFGNEAHLFIYRMGYEYILKPTVKRLKMKRALAGPHGRQIRLLADLNRVRLSSGRRLLAPQPYLPCGS
jgi:hypothetical protein